MKRLSLLCLGIFFIATQSAVADVPVPAHCSGESIRSISVRLFPEIRQSPLVEIKYQISNREQLNRKTAFIALPGGPGGAGIFEGTADEIAKIWGFPVGYPIITIDPRGVGCNAGDEAHFPNESIKTVNFAEDVFQILKKEKIRNYVIFGGSAGTQWATVLADRIQKAFFFPQPRAVVLRSTFGRSMTRDENSMIDYEIVWRKHFQKLTPATQTAFSSDTPPLGLTGAEWAPYLNLIASTGTYVRDGQIRYPAQSALERVSSGSDEAKLQLKNAVIQYYGYSQHPILKDGAERTYYQINCREMGRFLGRSNELIRGHLIWNDRANYCDDVSLDRPYDSARYQIRAPLVYIEGKLDPVTPEWQSRYHFNHQTKSKKIAYISAPLGAHSGYGNYLADCEVEVWRSILSDQKFRGLGAVLHQCLLKPTLEMKSP